jgi:hypothetical protein
MICWFRRKISQGAFHASTIVQLPSEKHDKRRRLERGAAATGPITHLSARHPHSRSFSGRAACTNQQPSNHPHDIPAMALNWTMLDEGRNPVPLPFEMIIKTMEGAELSLTIPEAPPSGSATSGGSGGTKKLKSTGRMWLTDQRVE